MRLLFLDEEFPYPLNSGKRIRTYSLVSRLAGRCAVDYLAFGRAGSEAAQALARAGVTVHPVEVDLPAKRGAGFYWRLLRNLAQRDPFSVTSHHHRRFAAAVDQHLMSRRYDAVVCEWTPYAQYVRHHRDVPRIVNAHNIEHRIWERLAAHEPNPLRRAYIAVQASKWRRFESGVFGSMDGATAVSRGDQAAIREMNARLTTALVENGVDLEGFRPADGEGEDGQLVFVGSLDWLANQDAVRHMAADIMPLVRREMPDAELSVVGRHPPAAIEDLSGRDGVTVVGTVPDVTPWVARAGVYVVPLRVGGGSRLKILEAMAMGRAVVSTTVGAEGLEVQDGRHLVIADGPEAFARAVVDLARDPRRRRELGLAGRRLVEDRYGWDNLATRYCEFLDEVVGGRS